MQNPRLFWIGPSFFSDALSAFGWDVTRVDHDLGSLRSWPDIMNLAEGRTPDALVVADCSAPPMVTGVESFPCLTVFYAVDSHIHSWYPMYAQAFDCCLVSLRDHLPLFCRGRLRAEDVLWSPPFARDEIRPAEETLAPRECDLLFVGTADPERTPERFRFFQELSAAWPGFVMTRGNFAHLFPKARLLLNECAAGDLNFRVFEALGCGGCLLTPRIGHGLLNLFTDRRDLFVYEQHSLPSLLSLLEELRHADDLCRKVAANGLAAVDAAHRATHRAASLDTALRARLDPQGDFARVRGGIDARLRAAPVIHREFLRLLYLLHADSVGVTSLSQGYLRAAQKEPHPRD